MTPLDSRPGSAELDREALPPVALVRQFDTHRLVLSRHLPHNDSVLVGISDDDAHLQAIFELDAATNDRLLAAQQRLPGIGLQELVFGVPHSGVINAAFCHPHPLGSRFNGPNRGAWYAAFDVETSKAEVGFHKTVQLAEIGRFEDTVTYDDYRCDVTATLHDLRSNPPGARQWLDPDSYEESQALGRTLLEDGIDGVVYRSVRHEGGECVACFRPRLVLNVRVAAHYEYRWDGHPVPTVRRLTA